MVNVPSLSLICEGGRLPLRRLLRTPSSNAPSDDRETREVYVRCAHYPGAYWRKLDRERAYSCEKKISRKLLSMEFFMV